ncbi:DUF2097 domain-containing protein [Methanobrevibacter filiformis]|uniref:DUF2097 domain-containing protein n=1 Tax=Methanobrevibacter filiformis TaxID=55758 RepID=A0A166DFX4_9EURY|nr:DUF2097 domain-containing protein [Methanobrevibacter filiformis]KZX15562.1 hypothetical protein MBFIL_06280 [Methanobrevibacter filiformis]
MEDEIFVKPDEALDYIKNNVKKHDTLELSYNRVYAPGEVLGVEVEEDWGEESLMVSIHLSGDLVNDVVRVNMNNIKDDLLEVRHLNNEKEVILVVEDDA